MYFCRILFQIGGYGGLVWAMGISVCGMYQMLTRQEMHSHDTVFPDIWLKSVPLKVSIYVWRLHRNRWPTKDNLVRRDIIADDSRLCVAGCNFNE
jgi:hypothetical protein